VQCARLTHRAYSKTDQADRCEGEPPQARVAGGCGLLWRCKQYELSPLIGRLIAAEDAHPSAPEA